MSRPRPVTVAGLAGAAGAAAGFGTLAGFLGEHWWALDLFAHFRVQYLVLLASAALVLWVARRRVLGVAYVALALVNLSLLAPFFLGPGPPASAPGAPVLRALLLNTNTYGGDPVRVAALIAEHSPEVVVLAEVDQHWLDALAGTLALYPHRVLAPRVDNFGIALLSRRPLHDPHVIRFGAHGLPSIEATLDWAGERLTILGTHPAPPYNRALTALRDAQLRALGERLRRHPRAVLLGDLNATPWSSGYRSLTRASDMRACARGRGLQPSWPTQMWPFRIPIDHCLATASVRIADQWVGPDVGSDHFPLFVEIAAAAAPDPDGAPRDTVLDRPEPDLPAAPGSFAGGEE